MIVADFIGVTNIQQILELPIYFTSDGKVFIPIKDAKIKEIPRNSGKQVIVFSGEKK